MKIELLDVEHCSTCSAEKMRGGAVKYWVSGKRGKELVEGGEGNDICERKRKKMLKLRGSQNEKR